MMVYLFGSQKKKQELTGVFAQMTRLLERAEIRVLSSLKPEVLEKEKEKVKASGGTMLLNHIESFILEVGTPDSEIGYILAHAIVYKKPILVIYRKNHEPRELLQNFRRKEVETFMRFQAYTEQTIERVMFDYLSWIDRNIKIERSNIKYTLRITSRISQYLTWKAKELHMQKVDYLRTLLDEQMKEDKSYQMYLEEVRKNIRGRGGESDSSLPSAPSSEDNSMLV